MAIASDRTLATYISWAHAHPAKHQGGPWATSSNSWCEQLVNNAGDFGSDFFASAALAGNASGPLNTNMASAEPGEFVYWTNHVGIVTSPGWMFCASQTFVGNGTGYGYMKIADYSRLHTTQHFRGHTYRHGNHVLKVPVPIKPPVVKPPVVVTGGPKTFLGSFPRGPVLAVNDKITAGHYNLIVGGNSIMVLQRSGTPVWFTSRIAAAKVGNHARTFAVLQPDGNFVLYGYNKKGVRFALWNSGTTLGKYRPAGEHVSLQPTGHLYVQPSAGIGKTIYGK